ncbi:MAG: KR domain-containing protein, partial [bacterium]|nr:KR domain-containing protein [bacterium]
PRARGRLPLDAHLYLKQKELGTHREPFEIMTFEEVWQEQALAETSGVKIKTVVCFLSQPGNQQAFVETLKPQTKIIFIRQGKTFEKKSPQAYTISRPDRGTYEQVFKSIREDHDEVDAVLYLWALEDPGCTRDYSCIVYLLQTLVSAKLKTRRLLLGAQFEEGTDRCYLESWIGFERSLGLVMPNMQVAAIYQDKKTGEGQAVLKDWVRKLWAELHSDKLQSAWYRGEKRVVLQVRPTTIEPGKNILKPGGTYLITGGCGGLGFLFARHFAKTHPVNLILTG